MDEDFAASLAIIAEAQQSMAATTRSLEANLQALHQLHRFALRVHAYALAMLVVSLVVSVVGLGGMAWLLTRHQGESAGMQQLILHNTQTIDAQTRALLEGRQSR
jgi:uncharacterized membrane protein YtjA (UPF0391 family)